MAKYDMTIIGGGSGGLTAARTVAALGISVLLIDKEKLGGDCLHYGCVPSKSMIHVAKVVRQTREAAKVGLMSADLGVDIRKAHAFAFPGIQDDFRSALLGGAMLKSDRAVERI